MPQVVYALLLNYNSSEDSVVLYNQLCALKMNELKVLIIDNNSVESQRKILLEKIPKNQLLFNFKNLGFAGGNNIGITCALNNEAEYIWILNPDIRIENTTLKILLNTINQDKTLAAVGPRICHRNAQRKIFSDGEKMIMNEKVSTYHKNHNLEVAKVPKGIEYDIDYIAGSSMLLSCKAIKEIGKFPEDYFLYFEETDWCFKAKQFNWNLAINTNSVVYNLTSIKTSVFHYYFMRNRLIFSRKYHPNYRKVRKHYTKEIIKEIIARFKGKYLKPYFYSRVRGLSMGLIKTSL